MYLLTVMTAYDLRAYLLVWNTFYFVLNISKLEHRVACWIWLSVSLRSTSVKKKTHNMRCESKKHSRKIKSRCRSATKQSATEQQMRYCWLVSAVCSHHGSRTGKQHRATEKKKIVVGKRSQRTTKWVFNWIINNLLSCRLNVCVSVWISNMICDFLFAFSRFQMKNWLVFMHRAWLGSQCPFVWWFVHDLFMDLYCLEIYCTYLQCINSTVSHLHIHK